MSTLLENIPQMSHWAMLQNETALVIFPTLCRPFPSNRQQKVKKGQNRDFFDMADFAWYSKNSLKIPSSPSFLSE